MKSNFFFVVDLIKLLKMSDSFDGSSVESLKWVIQFKKLDAKKKAGLTPTEQRIYDDLQHKIAHLMDPESRDKIPKRKDLRIALHHAVKLTSGKDFHKVYMKNISGGGIYVESEKLLPVGSRVRVNLELETENKQHSFETEVAWVNPKALGKIQCGMGLKFVDLTPQQQTILQSLVHDALDFEAGKKK